MYVTSKLLRKTRGEREQERARLAFLRGAFWLVRQHITRNTSQNTNHKPATTKKWGIYVEQTNKNIATV
jgi:hypothetical protein